MKFIRKARVPGTVLALAFAALMSACSAGPTSPAAGVSVTSGTMKNPNPPTPESIASGKRVYDRLCKNCHGPDGNGAGDPEMLAAPGPKPSDLTDDEWVYGSTDGEIFQIIRNGLGPNSLMQGINGKAGIYPEEIWNLVNYIRSLHRPAH